MYNRTPIARDASAHDLYTRAMQPYHRLRAQAEQERMLRAARAGRGSRLLRVLGSWLVAAGERMHAAGSTKSQIDEQAGQGARLARPVRRKNAQF